MRHKFFFALATILFAVSLPAQVVVETFLDNFPTPAGSVGRVILLTTTTSPAVGMPRGLWVHVGGGNWSPLNGGVANVADFGAWPDDGNDDTTAIQNAVNAVQAMPMGGTVYIPAGKYKLTGTISVTQGGVWIRGAGMTSTFLEAFSGTYDSSKGIVRFYNTAATPSPSGISELQIYSALSESSNDLTGVVIKNSVSVYVDHFWTNALRNGVRLENTGDCVIRDSVLERSYDYGLLAETSSPLRVHDTEAFSNNKGGFYIKTAKTPISAYDQTDPVILSNCQSTEDESSATAAFGFRIEGHRNVTLIGPQVGDRYFEHPQHGIDIVGSYRVNVVGAQITHTKRYGIYVEDSHEVSITGSVINATGHYVTAPSAAVVGIYADTASSAVSIVGGSINKSQGNGILFAARGGQISNVSIIDPALHGQSGTGLNGIEVTTTDSGALPKLTIANNSFRIIDGGTTSRTAINITSTTGSDVIVSGNHVENFPAGLAAHSSANVRAFKNLGIVNDEDIGISLSSTSGTISVAQAIHEVTGNSPISTINVPSWCAAGCTVALVPKGTWSLTATGNIALAATAVPNRTLHVTWVPSDKWYPSY